MAQTTGAYRAVTIVALLIGAALIVFFGVLYTQNKSKWEILDSHPASLKGLNGKLTLLSLIGASNGFQVQNNLGTEQFASFIAAPDPAKPYNTIRSPQGSYDVAMGKPPVEYK